MIGVMSNEEVQSLLRRKKLGRIAMSTNDRPYVTPINFAYDGEFVYCCSSFGRKIATMREQPLVCFEVEEIDEGLSALVHDMEDTMSTAPGVGPVLLPQPARA